MTDWDYEKAAGLKFIAGRPFDPDYKTDSNGVILNESAAKLIGYKNPIGRTIHLGDQQLTIVGITKNVLMQDPLVSEKHWVQQQPDCGCCCPKNLYY